MSTMKKILVIDDNRAIARLVGIHAAALGLPCVETSDATDFFAELSPEVTLILLDLAMPGMDGIELLRQLAQQQCRPDIVLMSGAGARIIETAEQLAQNFGFCIVGRLEKPFRAAELKIILKRHLEAVIPPIAKTKSVVLIEDDDLRKAIELDQLVVHYQPQIDLLTGNVIAVEALVRWQHPDYGLLYPDSFIGRMEALGLIDQLGWLVAARGLSDVGKFSDGNGDPIELALNISAYSLHDLNLPDTLSALVKNFDVPIGNVTLEITESGLLGNLTIALDVLCRLRLNGSRLAIDDFGTGYSMMQQLRNIPATDLKIDKSFVQSMLTNNRDRVLVLKTIEMGRELSMRVTAEGVETSDQLDYLRLIGCDIGQGYFFSRPLPVGGIVDWLEGYRAGQLSNTPAA